MLATSIRYSFWLGGLVGTVSLGVRASAEDATLPLITAASAEKYDGQAAAIEASVVEVKFAQRRKFYFLSGSANFRSDSNMPVAIRAGDFEAFQQAGIPDLSAKYLGQKIRARGKVVRDEGQWLLVVAVPGDIEVVDSATAVERRREIVIIDEQGRQTRVAFPWAGDVQRTIAALEHEGTKETFGGVALAELLGRAKIALGAESRGNELRRFVIVTGHDGYAALFSVAEIDPYFAQQPVLIADDLNAGPLPAPHGPLRLIVPADKHRRRWVGQVATIEVHNAPQKPALERSAP